jgi:hypothetical protein
MHDRLKFRKVGARWVPKELMAREKIKRMCLSLQHLLWYGDEKKIRLTGLLLGTNHGCTTTNQNQSVLRCKGNTNKKKSKFKVTPSARMVMLNVFGDSQGVLLTSFQVRGENVNSASYCEVLLKLRDEIRRKSPGQLERGALIHHDIARPHTAQATQESIQVQSEIPEHLPYSPDLAPGDFHLFGPLKTTLLVNVLLITKRLKRRCESG